MACESLGAQKPHTIAFERLGAQKPHTKGSLQLVALGNEGSTKSTVIGAFLLHFWPGNACFIVVFGTTPTKCLVVWGAVVHQLQNA
eukprot:3488298-Amphidinium_carterae.1